MAGAGAQAQDADDNILYNTATGQLSYDADGNGAGLAVAFATLFGQPTLSASDMRRSRGVAARGTGNRIRECRGPGSGVAEFRDLNRGGAGIVP